MDSPSQSLSTIQRWMQAVIQHPGGIEAALADHPAEPHPIAACRDVTTVILPSTRQTSAQRLQIYADAYFSRLLEVLLSEFPALAHALGDELFTEFAAGYLQEHPSQSYSLSELGLHFPAHLKATRPPREADEPDWADFLIDCCQLERIYAEVFDGPGPERPTNSRWPMDFASLTPESFAEARLRMVPWLRLVAVRFPVESYISAVRRGDAPDIPAPRATYLVVSRRDYIVRRVPVSHAEFRVLSALQKGATIGEALLAAADTGAIEASSDEQVKQWFTAWTAAGYLQGIEGPSEIHPVARRQANDRQHGNA
jgi:hypothetical protein